MQFFGTEGRIDVEIPFNAPTDKPTRIFIDNGKDLYANASAVIETVPICNQFTIQADLFSKAVLENTEVPNPLEERLLQYGGDRRGVPLRRNRQMGGSRTFIGKRPPSPNHHREWWEWLVVILLAKVRDEVFANHPAQSVFQLHQLDEQVVLRIKLGRGHRRLEVEAQPLLNAA